MIMTGKMTKKIQLPIDILRVIGSFDNRFLCILHQSGIKIHKRDCSYALFRYLVKNNHTRIFNYCLALQPDILLNQSEMEGLFDLAVLYDHVEMTRIICSRVQIHEQVIYDYLIYGIQENLLNCVYFFINEMDVLLEYNQYQVICEAVRYNNLPLVQYLMDHPEVENPSMESNSILITAILCQNKPIFRYLLNHPKIEPHQPDNEPFQVALDMGNEWFLEKLLNNQYVSRTLQLDTDDIDRLYDCIY